MQQHHPTALQHYKDSYDKVNKLKCQLTIHHYKVVNSYIYEVRVDARLGTLFDAHLNSFRSESTSEPIDLQFFSSPDLTTHPLERDITTEQLIFSLFPNMKGEYEIYCISTEDFNVMKARHWIETSGKTGRSGGHRL